MINNNLEGKVIIVTGANSGMGKLMTEKFADQGATVLMVCRKREAAIKSWEEVRGKTKNPNLIFFQTDFSIQQETKDLAQEIKEKYPKIDVLINNAAGVNYGYTETAEGIETTFATNHLGYFLFTNLLLDNILAADQARIINVSSDAEKAGKIDFDDLNSKDNYSYFKAYSNSKLANLLFTYELARKLRDTTVKVNAVHPGVVPGTNLGKGSKSFQRFMDAVPDSAKRTHEQGIETTIWLATSPDTQDITGKYFTDMNEISSSPSSYDEELAKKLWQVSQKLTGLE